MRALALLAITCASACGPTDLYRLDDKNGIPFLRIVSEDVQKATYEETLVQVKVVGRLREPTNLIDLNRAEKATLLKLPDVTEEIATKIINHRLYASRRDLVTKKILTEEQLARIAPFAGAGPIELEEKKRERSVPMVAYVLKMEDALKMYDAFINTRELVEVWEGTGKQLLVHVQKGEATLIPPPPLKARDVLAGKARLVSVERSRVQVPDSEVRYLQVSAPRGGTANAEFDLAPNGTLAKAIAATQDQLPGALITAGSSIVSAGLGSAALNTIAVARFPPPPAPPTATADGQEVLQVDLTITPIRRVYTITLVHRSDDDESCAGKIHDLLPADGDGGAVTNVFGDTSCRASFTVAVQGGGDAPPAAKVENQLTFEGSVSLPKAGGAEK